MEARGVMLIAILLKEMLLMWIIRVKWRIRSKIMGGVTPTKREKNSRMLTHTTMYFSARTP